MRNVIRINKQDPKYAYVLIVAGVVLYYFSLIKANPLAFLYAEHIYEECVCGPLRIFAMLLF